MSTTFVPGHGNKQAKIVLVGEQPAKYEVRLGKPFTGPAGLNLDDCLRNAGIRRSDCWVTNVIKDADGELARYVKIVSGKRESIKPTKLGEFYRNMLREELEQIKPNVVVPMGNAAMWALADRANIVMWRGSVIESTLIPNLKLVPTLHPASYTDEKVRRAADAYLNRYLIIMDLKKVKHEAGSPGFKYKDLHLRIRPTYMEALDFLQQCIDSAAKGATVIYDIELVPGSQELSCISLATDGESAMSIPFVYSGGDYFSADQELTIMRKLCELLENEDYVKGGQNIGFDAHFLLRKYGIRTRNISRDTMIAQRILYPEFSKMHGGGGALNFITSMWTDIPYYKADGKIWISGGSDWDKGWKYNALDSVACAESFPKQLAEIEEKGNSQTYERQVKLIEPLVYMQEHGIRIDLKGLKQEYDNCIREVEQMQEGLNAKVGFELNPDSPKQVAEYFYNKLRLRPRTNNGKVTVDEDALRSIFNEGNEAAGMILQMRRIGKRGSTFCDPKKVDSDGRMRCSYNPAGTKFGRISSSRNIFGTGINLQNVPHSVLTHFLIDRGYVGYSLDMSQIENRIVAYVGRIAQMIQVFTQGLDSHRQTGSLIFRKAYDDVSDEPGSSTLGDKKHSERDWAKRANHGFNYGYGPASFAEKYDMPLIQAKQIHAAYHRAYPQLESGYWAYVQSELKRTHYLTNLHGRKTLFLGKWGEKMLNAAYSCIPQGTNGDHVNELGVEFVYYNTSELFRKVELLLQIHDSIDFQIPLSLPLIDHARILLDIKQSLETPLEWRINQFIVPADLTVKFNLNKNLGVELKGSKFCGRVEELARNLLGSIAELKLGKAFRNKEETHKRHLFGCRFCPWETERWNGTVHQGDLLLLHVEDMHQGMTFRQMGLADDKELVEYLYDELYKLEGIGELSGNSAP